MGRQPTPLGLGGYFVRVANEDMVWGGFLCLLETGLPDVWILIRGRVTVMISAELGTRDANGGQNEAITGDGRRRN